MLLRPGRMLAKPAVVFPALDLIFVGAAALDSRITFTRATAATYFNSSGVLTTASSGAARLDYNPSTLVARGLLIEEARTNSLINAQAAGSTNGALGGAGALPTGWAVYNPDSLTITVVGSGTELGRAYVEVRFQGTGGANGFAQINLGAAVTATQNQTWTLGADFRLSSGSLATVTTQLQINSVTAGGAFIAAYSGSAFVATASYQRTSTTQTLLDATTGKAQGIFTVGFGNGAAVDATFRIACPQMEVGAFATSYIPTTAATVTRNADVATVATSAYPSNAVTGTLIVDAMIEAIAAAAQAQVQLDDGSADNRVLLSTAATTATAAVLTASGASATNVNPTGTATALTTFRCGVSWVAGASSSSFNGGTVATAAPAGAPVTPTTLRLGNNFGSTAALNGWLRRVRYFGRRLSDPTLKALTT